MRKIYIILLVIISTFIISCELEDNISPNLPDSKNVSARQRLAAAQVDAYRVQGADMNALGNVFMNAYAGNVYWFGDPIADAVRLNIHNNFYSGIWNRIYLNVGELQEIIDGDSVLVYHIAIAKILKAHYMQYIVDLYNDAPYSDAFGREDNINPKYDNSVEIYKALIGEINGAIKLIKDNAENSSNTVDSREDVIFGGDMAKWILFANTVKLRYLVRMSKTTNTDAISFRDEQLQTLKGAKFVDFDVTLNPGYTAASEDSQNPIYDELGFRNYDGTTNTYGWRLYKASAHIADALNGETTAPSNGTKDPRASSIFYLYGSDNKDTVYGVVQGAKKDHSKSEFQFASIGGWLKTGAKEGSSHDGYLMLKSESEFLQAEAAVEFPSVFADGQSHFENGIKASFDFYELGDKAATYIAEIDSKDKCGWTGSADKLSAIQYQRWIALTNINAMETYLDYLKTGYPETPLAIGAEKNHKPYRLIYPSSEYSANASNVPNMSSDDAFDKNGKYTPFWLK